MSETDSVVVPARDSSNGERRTTDDALVGNEPGSLQPRTTAVFLLVCGLSIPIVALNPTALSGDPAIYLSRIEEFFEGGFPYLGAPFEHLPLVVLPMMLAWLLGGWFGSTAYTVVFAVLMAACLWGTAVLVDRLGSHLHTSGPGLQFLLIAGPLFPLVLFRTDPLPVLLATAAIGAMFAGRERRAFTWTLLGVLAKGWPLVLAVVDWWRGKRKKALLLVSVSLVLLVGLWLLPGFRSGRVFTGIHTDSIVGSVFAQLRDIQGEPVGRFDAAGAIYLEAPTWAVLVNANLGLIVATVALVRLGRTYSRIEAVNLCAALVLAILVASPLLSPQFIIWPTAFLALHPSRSVRYLSVALTGLTLIFMLGWNPVYEGNLWWLPLVTLRNVVLLALAFMVAVRIGRWAPDTGMPR